MIEFREISWDNFWDVIELKVKSHQEEFIHPNAIFLAQAYLNLKSNHPDIAFAIYSNGSLVGFSKVVLVPENVTPYFFSDTVYMIDAFMIDARYQSSGLGKMAFRYLLDYLKTMPFGVVKDVTLMCSMNNDKGSSFFRDFGFCFVKELKRSSGTYQLMKYGIT